jgi:hypothetical protein
MVLKEDFHFLECIRIPAELIKAIPRPEQGRFSNGISGPFLMDPMKKSISFFIGVPLKLNPPAGIKGIVIKFTLRIFLHDPSKKLKGLLYPSLTVC